MTSMLCGWICAAALLGPAVDEDQEQAPAGLRVSFEAPAFYVSGRPFEVQIEVIAPASGGPVAGWLLSPAAFTVDGEPLSRRTEDVFVPLPPNAHLSLTFDLAAFLAPRGDFDLALARGAGASDPIRVKRLVPIGTGEEAPDFMELGSEQLGQYVVLMETVRGDMLFEFWPDVAPGHVRNFLDLCHNGFYEDLLFHRIIPGFMIQGGCPNTKHPDRRHQWGMGGGPRATLQAEFNRRADRRHVRGVLSMARSQSPDSASSQFFVMHADNASLDGQYSTFGRLVSGHEVVDRIVETPRDPQDRPREPQRIVRTTVLVAGS